MTRSRITVLSAIASTVLMLGSFAASAACADSNVSQINLIGPANGVSEGGASTVGFGGTDASKGESRKVDGRVKSESDFAISSALDRSKWSADNGPLAW